MAGSVQKPLGFIIKTRYVVAYLHRNALKPSREEAAAQLATRAEQTPKPVVYVDLEELGLLPLAARRGDSGPTILGRYAEANALLDRLDMLTLRDVATLRSAPDPVAGLRHDFRGAHLPKGLEADPGSLFGLVRTEGLVEELDCARALLQFVGPLGGSKPCAVRSNFQLVVVAPGEEEKNVIERLRRFYMPYHDLRSYAYGERQAPPDLSGLDIFTPRR